MLIKVFIAQEGFFVDLLFKRKFFPIVKLSKCLTCHNEHLFFTNTEMIKFIIDTISSAL